MAKDKERAINPAQQARTQEKNRAIKKAKLEQQARRNEKFARRNPDRIQRQIDDLKALESSSEIKPREKAILAELERDLRAVKKAREALGDKAPTFGNTHPRDERVLGKRGRDGEHRFSRPPKDRDSDSGFETDESVRAIPMPRDTPPPAPREHQHRHQGRHLPPSHAQVRSMDQPSARLITPVIGNQTTYSAAPQLRNLRQEATSRFVPSVVKRKLDTIHGVGGALVEPEELDRLEAAGYHHQKQERAGDTASGSNGEISTTLSKIEADRLAQEEARFAIEIGLVDAETHRNDDEVAMSQSHVPHHVEIEEVEDEDL